MDQIPSFHGNNNAIWSVGTLLQSMLIVHNQASTKRADSVEAVATLHKQYVKSINFFLRPYTWPK